MRDLDPDAVLEVGDLSYAYGSRRALDRVSFAVRRGEFRALLGPNGAGKSTLFALLTRLFASRGGRIRVEGHDLSREPRRVLSRIGVVFQQPTLDLDLTVRRNLLYFAALHGLGGREAETRADAALERLAMRERAGERARDLNGGHRRRTEIARALIHRPALLLLDEPTVGLDAESRGAIVDHVHGLCAEEGLSVLWATHLVDEIRPEDALLVLHRGRLLADAPAAEVAASRPLGEAFIAMTREAA